MSVELLGRDQLPPDETSAAALPIRPARRSGYASTRSTPRRLFGRVAKSLGSFAMTVTGEGGEAGGGKDELGDRRFIVLLEVAKQPAGRDPRMPAWFLAGDQERELERIGQPEPGKLLGRRLGAHQIPALKRPREDRVRVAL